MVLRLEHWTCLILLCSNAIQAFFIVPSKTRQFFLRSQDERKSRYRNKTKTKHKPRSKKITAAKRQRPSGPRPVVCNYDLNRSERVNEERLTASIGCEHFGQCSGCVRDENVGLVSIIESAKLYFSSTAVRKSRYDVLSKGLEWAVETKDDGFYKVVVPSEVQGWRTQAKLAVAPKSSSWARDGCEFGLYERGSHRVLPIPNCQVHHPAINRAVEALRSATAKTGTTAIEGLRYVQLQVERLSGKIALTLIWNAATLKETQPQLSRLVKELTKSEADLWHSIWCHCNNGTGNNIFNRNPRSWHRLVGQELMREPLAVGDQGWLYFSPLTFRQGNLDGFDIIATDVARAVPEGSKVCELYAGVGLLGLNALAFNEEEGVPLEWLRCSDENPANPRCFQRAVESLPLTMSGLNRISKTRREPSMTLEELARRIDEDGIMPGIDDKPVEKVAYTVASAGDALRQGQALGANVLIVDPPRKGLERDVLDELRKPFNPDQPSVDSADLLPDDYRISWTNDVQTLIYVSCGFDALVRDSEQLLRSGWILHSATGYVLFPGSDHVETVCVFERK